MPKDVTVGTTLPPGQQPISDFPRFGPTSYAVLPEVASEAMLAVLGDLKTPFEVSLKELIILPHHEQTSDLHCVTT